MLQVNTVPSPKLASAIRAAILFYSSILKRKEKKERKERGEKKKKKYKKWGEGHKKEGGEDTKKKEKKKTKNYLVIVTFYLLIHIRIQSNKRINKNWNNKFFFYS